MFLKNLRRSGRDPRLGRAALPRRSPGDPARQPRARGRGRESLRREAQASSPGRRECLILKSRVWRRFSSSQIKAGRRRRHSLRRSERRPGHARDAGADVRDHRRRTRRFSRPDHGWTFLRRNLWNGCRPRRTRGGIGSNLALVNEGDSITIDAERGLLQLNVPDDELARRRENWRPPTPRYTSASSQNTQRSSVARVRAQ